MKLILENVTKFYGALPVFSGLNLEFTGPDIYCLMAPSGAGKTTLFRLILSLEQPDAGTIRVLGTDEFGAAGPEDDRTVSADHGTVTTAHDTVSTAHSTVTTARFSAVFQEDRLIGHLTPVENLRLVLGNSRSREELTEKLQSLLPTESLNRPVSTLSGGMKRRLAFLRAILAPSDIVLLDEPFTGLDDKNKELVIRFLLAHRNGRLFLITTHNRDDVEKLGAKLITL